MAIEMNSPYQSARDTESGPGSAIGNPGGSIQDAMDASRTRLNAAYATVQQRSNEMLEEAEGYIQRRPMQAVIYAASVGAVVGLVAGIILGAHSGGKWHRRWW